MNRDSIEWRGYMPAITTPFHADGSIDWEGFETFLEWLHAEGMHGVVVCGSTGEWFSMSAQERADVFKAAARVLKGRIPVIGGCVDFTPQGVLGHAAAAAAAGLDGILVTPPPYVVPTPDELVAFYRAVSDGSELPIVVYNWPRGTNVDIAPDVLDRLADVERVVAIKNSTDDIGLFLNGFFRVADRVRYFGFRMDELGMTMITQHGGDGTVGAGAVLGSDHPSFYEALWKGDLDAARHYGQRDLTYIVDWFGQGYTTLGQPQAVFKAALNLRGLPGGHVRPPLLPLAPEGVEQVRATFEKLGVAVVANV